MSGFTFFAPHPALADVIEAIWDADIPDSRKAQAIAIRVLPVASPQLCFHYHAPTAAQEWAHSRYNRMRITGVQSQAVTLRPSGPIAGVMVRLKPEAAARLIGNCVDQFKDGAFPLGDVFCPSQLSLVEEMLAEASNAARRATVVQSFLFQCLRDDGPDPLARRAAIWLRRDPTLPVHQLASRLEISERHLSRRFQAAIGTAPKQFARIARMGKVLAAARRHRAGWAEIAQACGFNDQAHMINDFNAMVGSSPDAFFRATSVGDGRELNASLAESAFSNTFVTG